MALFNNFTCSFDKISGFASELTGLKLSVGWCWEQYDRAGHRAETAEFKEEVKEWLHDEKVIPPTRRVPGAAGGTPGSIPCRRRSSPCSTHP